MLVRLQGVLNSEQVQVAADLLSRCTFADGVESAGARAGRVKRNLEAAGGQSSLTPVNNLVMGALLRHPDYRAAALARSVAAPFYSRYRSGMHYGSHIDDPIMGGSAPYRSDIAITIFLSDPAAYGGGELAIESRFGPQAIKLPAGDAALYPASNVHEVRPVTSGERLVAVTWVQSLVRDAHKRELLFELHQAREQMLREAPESEAAQRLEVVYANLVRLWAEI
jgi:PKHD-type hydroxylase